MKESARHPQPQSGAASTATADAVAFFRARRRRTLVRSLITAAALGAIVTLARTLPAERNGASAVTTTASPGDRARPSDRHLDTTPPRTSAGLALVRNGWIYNCMECHTLLGARWRYDRPLNEHRDVALEHGNNRYCLNCHHPTNRNAFGDYDGAEIVQANVVDLCAKCHGTIYRDWQAGVHGRRNGHWRAAAGTGSNLRCVECHDPHRPKFADMKPLAPLRYPARAAGGRTHAPVSSSAYRIPGTVEPFAAVESQTHSDAGTEFNPKRETRNPQPRASATP